MHMLRAIAIFLFSVSDFYWPSPNNGNKGTENVARLRGTPGNSALGRQRPTNSGKMLDDWAIPNLKSGLDVD